ncbi:MAG TPA: hypothetical protein VMW46_07375 [Candidatus Desulfaltia sp.]|nr:hypothetical protein [Candidatus Desulfaltia sp.]
MEKSNEEQAVKSSATEATVQPSEKATPKSMREAINLFNEDQAKSAEKAGAKPSEEEEKGQGKEKKEPCPECEKSDEELLGEGTPLYIVDKDGKKTPLKFKADGKEHSPDSIEKALMYMSGGVHANTRLEEINQAAEVLKAMFDAINSGKLQPGQLKGDGKRAEEEKEPEEDLSTLDPDLRKEVEIRKGLQKELEKQKKDTQSLKTFMASRLFSEEKKSIDTEIEKHKKPYYLAADTPSMVTRIWGLLRKVDEKTKQPTYTVEEAMKEIHNEELSRFKKFVKEHPEQQDKEAIISDFIKTREEKNAAPVGSPSGAPAGGAPTGEKKAKYKSLREAVADANVWLEEQKRAAKTL